MTTTFTKALTKANITPEQSSTQIDILLTNLGTPNTPTPKAVRQFLKNFLSDPRVIEIPKSLWWWILNGVILPRRAKSTAANYAKIWTEHGSPLFHYTKLLQLKLQKSLSASHPELYRVRFAMSYSEPSLSSILEELHHKNTNKIIILPLYPQYSATTSAAVFDSVTRILQSWRFVPEIIFLNQYALSPQYHEAIAQQIQTYWQQHGRGDKLLFSFHGLPKRNIQLGDPYYDFCMMTANAVAQRSQLEPSTWQVVFQSRFGYQEWLQPYCDETLITLGKLHTKRIDIICPGFAIDCLETLEEMNITNRALFLNHGGQEFHYIPCLNDSNTHVELLKSLVLKYENYTHRA